MNNGKHESHRRHVITTHTQRGGTWVAEISDGTKSRKKGRATPPHLVVVGHLHGGDCVAGVHGALEGALVHHGQDVRQRGAVQQGSRTGQIVLAIVSGRGQDVSVLLGHLGDDRGDVLGERVHQGLVLNNEHLGDTRHTSGVLGDGIEALAQHQDRNLKWDEKLQSNAFMSCG